MRGNAALASAAKTAASLKAILSGLDKDSPPAFTEDRLGSRPELRDQASDDEEDAAAAGGLTLFGAARKAGADAAAPSSSGKKKRAGKGH